MRYFIAVYKNTEVGLTDVNHNIIIMKLQKKDSLRAFTSSTNVVVYIYFTSAALLNLEIKQYCHVLATVVCF